MKIFLKVCIYLNIFTSISAELNLKGLQELIAHHTFLSSTYNIIICKEHGSLNLIKMLSEGFQRFVAVHKASKTLSPVLDEPQTFLLDLQCSEASAVLKQAEDLKLFRKPFKWLLLNDGTASNVTFENDYFSGNEESWVWPFLETSTALTDSDVNVLEKVSDEKIMITGAYKLENNLIREPLAEWIWNKGLVILNSKPIAIRRWNLQGAVIPSSIVLTDRKSLEHLEDFFDKHIDTSPKVSYNIVNLFGDLFNVSIKYKIETEWGIFKNGSWTGMAGDLEKKQIEFGASPLFFQKERLYFLEYFSSVNPSRARFIFLSPPLSYSSNIFAMPFDSFVWGCCFCMVAVSCFFLYTALNFEKSHFTIREGIPENEFPKISFTEILVLNIGAICLQGTVAQTKDPPGRIMTLVLYLAYMFLYISYSASIVAILQSSDTSIQTLSDFLKSSLKAGADDVAYSQYYFKTADDEVRKEIYRTKIAPKNEAPHFLPVEEGIKEVKKGFYGFHVEVSVGYQVIQKTFNEEEKCALQELRDSFIKFSDPWLAMTKKSPYGEHFKIGILKIIETGFKSRFVDRYYTKKPECTSKSSRFVSVGIVDCYFAFVLLMGGLISAVLILVLEFTFSRTLKGRKKQRLQNAFSFIGTEFSN